MLIGGEHNIEQAFKKYNAAWRKLSLKLKAKPTTISWKVASKDDLFKNLEVLKNQTEQVHIGTVNDRFIASVVLTQPIHNMSIIKILERRAGSRDLLGLDSIDYLVENINASHEKIKDYGAVKESNAMHEWLSLRFGENKEFEAKFTDHLVLEVAIKELQLSINKINKGP
jgi:hypothetical protein